MQIIFPSQIISFIGLFMSILIIEVCFGQMKNPSKFCKINSTFIDWVFDMINDEQVSKVEYIFWQHGI